jgi:hypothetical protein
MIVLWVMLSGLGGGRTMTPERCPLPSFSLSLSLSLAPLDITSYHVISRHTHAHTHVLVGTW